MIMVFKMSWGSRSIVAIAGVLLLIASSMENGCAAAYQMTKLPSNQGVLIRTNLVLEEESIRQRGRRGGPMMAVPPSSSNRQEVQMQAVVARDTNEDPTNKRGGRRKRRWFRRLLPRPSSFVHHPQQPSNEDEFSWGKELQQVESTSSRADMENGTGLPQVDLPRWASSQRDELKRLAATKELLQKDFDKIRDNTVQINERGPPVSVMEAFPDVYGDLRLLRFLRKDKVQDPVSAANRYRKFLEWRQESRVDEIRARVEQQQQDSHQDNDNLISDHIPCDFTMLDRVPSEYGSFPIVLHVGEWKTHTIADMISQGKLGLQDFLTHWTFMLESLHRDLYRESYRKGRLVYVDEICDLAQLSMRQFSPTFVARVLEPWVSLSQKYYPETTKRIVFLNPPRILTLVWNIVARFVSPGTKAKVKVTGFNGSSWDFVRQLYN